MKKALVVVGLILCMVVQIGPAYSAEKKLRNPERAAAENNYGTVMSYLDQGGDMLVFANLEGVVERTVERMLAGISLAAVAEPDSGALNAIINRLPDFLEEKGFYAVESVGMSAVPLGDGRNRIKLFVQRDPGATDTKLWKGLFSGDPARLRVLDFAPADSVMVRAGSGEIDQIWAVIREMIAEIAPPEASARFEQSLAAASEKLGTDIDSIIDSVGNQGSLSLSLDHDKKIALPAKQALVVPAPSVLVALKVEDNTVADLVDRKIAAAGRGQGGPSVTRSVVGGTELRKINMPLPLPLPVQITYATHKGYFLMGSTAGIVEKAIRSFDNKTGLVAQDRFRKSFKDLPLVNNGLIYVDRSLGELILDVQKKMMLAESPEAQSDDYVAAVNKLLSYSEPFSSEMVLVNGEDGVLLQGRSTMGASEVVMATSAAPVGLMAAIAIPSFIKARETAQQNACINNLRQLDSAKEQWALAENKMTGDQPVTNEVLQYVKGAEMPTCPEGGEYTLHPIGRDPECSVHGTLGDQTGR
jgi:hypothetical protein